METQRDCIKNVQVFNTQTVIRMGLQNRVLRKLREMGCQVVSMSLDSQLTICLQHPVPSALLKRRSGWSLQKTMEGDIVTIDVDGCRVVWINPADAKERRLVVTSVSLVGQAEKSFQLGYNN